MSVECVKKEKMMPADDDICEVIGDAMSVRGNKIGGGRHCYQYNGV